MSVYDAVPPPLFPGPPDADHLRPSIFELLANEQLHDLFGPVVRYTLTVSDLGLCHMVRPLMGQYLSQQYPRRLSRLVRYHPELTAVLLGLVENWHLKRHSEPSGRASRAGLTV